VTSFANPDEKHASDFSQNMGHPNGSENQWCRFCSCRIVTQRVLVWQTKRLFCAFFAADVDDTGG
jgi:hypothetical protein